MTRFPTSIRRSLAVALLFALLGVVVVAPLTLRLDSVVPGERPPSPRVLDYYHFHWNLWWLRYAVAHGENIWYTDRVLAPFEHNLTYHSLTASLLPVYLVFEPLVGHLRTANGIVWGSMALTGGLMFALLRRHRVSRALAILGGAGLAMSPYMLHHMGSGHLNLITVWWLPLLLMVWERVPATGRVRWALLTGIVLWGMWFTDTLIVLWGGLLLGPYALWHLWIAPDRAARGRLIGLGLLALVVTLGLAWWLGPLRPTLDFDTSDLAPARLLTLRYYSVPLKALFFQPGADNRSIGRLPVALILAALLLTRKSPAHRERWLWLAAGGFALILTLGPDVRLLGARVPLPFRLVHELFNGQMRTPVRFLPPAMVGLILFLALSFDPWVRRRGVSGRTWLAALGLLALAADFGALKPLPTVPRLRDYTFYHMLRAEHYDDYDYVVLEVPSSPSNGWDELGTHAEAMVYGITHEKRMVSGLLSRIPVEQRIFYVESPLLGWLIGVRPLDASAAKAELFRVVERGEWTATGQPSVQDGPVGYVVMHQDWIDDPRWLGDILALFNEPPTPLCYVTTEGPAVLYRADVHPKECPPRTPPESAPGTYTLDLGAPGDEGLIGHGWFWQETIVGTSARWAGAYPPDAAESDPATEALLYVDLPPGTDYRVTIHATAHAEPRTVSLLAAYLVDGALVKAELGSVTVQPGGWASYTLPDAIPADLLAQTGGHLALQLKADGLVDIGERWLSVAYDSIAFEGDAP